MDVLIEQKTEANYTPISISPMTSRKWIKMKRLFLFLQ